MPQGKHSKIQEELLTTININKILHCLENGCQLGWLIDPEARSILAFPPGQQPKIFSSDEDVLPTPEFLTELSLTSDRLFAWLKLSHEDAGQ